MKKSNIEEPESKKIYSIPEGIHRTGVEPVPLAWKASMITASPSVLTSSRGTIQVQIRNTTRSSQNPQPTTNGNYVTVKIRDSMFYECNDCNPQARRRYRPPTSFAASLAIRALFFRCSSAARSLISSTACVSGNPIFQYPGGVGARSH